METMRASKGRHCTIMGYLKLTKEKLSHAHSRGSATVSFTKRGIVILSGQALKRLDLDRENSLVDIFQGDVSSEFFISQGSSYRLRKNGTRGAVFNSSDLCSLVIEKTWVVHSHASGDPVPDKFSFIICERPVDDEENFHIHALIRKKG